MALVGARRGLAVQRWLDRKRDDRKIERMLIAYRRRYDTPGVLAGVLTGYWPSAHMGLTGVLTSQLVAYKRKYAAQCFRREPSAAKLSCSEPMAAESGPLHCSERRWIVDCCGTPCCSSTGA
jgi:hypothetical protein